MNSISFQLDEVELLTMLLEKLRYGEIEEVAQHHIDYIVVKKNQDSK